MTSPQTYIQIAGREKNILQRISYENNGNISLWLNLLLFQRWILSARFCFFSVTIEHLNAKSIHRLILILLKSSIQRPQSLRIHCSLHFLMYWFHLFLLDQMKIEEFSYKLGPLRGISFIHTYSILRQREKLSNLFYFLPVHTGSTAPVVLVCSSSFLKPKTQSRKNPTHARI